jgi:pimeloyl-ACP methyl ester carboxylesterase
VPVLDAERRMALASVMSWLGPWRRASAIPHGVRRERHLLRDGWIPGRKGRRLGPIDRRGPARLEAWVFTPVRRPLGTYLVVPGLHFDGPEDPRLERFCRVLAHAGFRVVAPTLPAYAELVVHPSAVDDLELVAAEVARELRPGERMTLFSISFGSWPALEVAARRPDWVDAVITFGGYAEFDAAVRFAVDGVMRRPEGDVKLTRDPLNQPALFVNMLPFLEIDGDTRALEEAWRQMTYRTWGRMELKAPGRLAPFAEELVARVAPSQRELFLVGCGVRRGGSELVLQALERAGDAVRFASPDAAIRQLRRPVVVCHGRDDDVIPWNEAEKLHATLSTRVPVELLLTGLYGHTGAARPTPAALAREARTLWSIARTLAHGGRVATLLER